MSEQYYVASRGRITGPFDLERLQALKSRGQLSRTHRLSVDRRKWFPARSLPELFPAESVRDLDRNPGPEPDDAVPASPSVANASSQSALTNTVEWFYHTGAQQYGPVSTSQMRALVVDGGVQDWDMVWREGMEEWRAVSDVSELHPKPLIDSEASTSTRTGHPKSAGRNGLASAAMWLGITPWIVSLVGFLVLLLMGVAAGSGEGPGGYVALLGGSIIFAILSNIVWLICSVLAVVFGSVAMGRDTGRGQAVAGLSLGIVNSVLMLVSWLILTL